MRNAQEPIQLSGFYVAGFFCVVAAVLKLTIERHWSWWRVLLPLGAVLGHNLLYILVGFAWLFCVLSARLRKLKWPNSQHDDSGSRRTSGLRWIGEAFQRGAGRNG
jgi:hypothetical protein